MNAQGANLVLIAEDHADTRSFLRVMLESSGYTIIEACDGKEAVFQALKERPDLILMDIAMPELDGIQAITEIRKTDEISKTQIVGITAQTDEYIEDALDAGCNQIIRKPIAWETLKPVISVCLEAGKL